MNTISSPPYGYITHPDGSLIAQNTFRKPAFTYFAMRFYPLLHNAVTLSPETVKPILGGGSIGHMHIQTLLLYILPIIKTKIVLKYILCVILSIIIVNHYTRNIHTDRGETKRVQCKTCTLFLWDVLDSNQ